MKYSIFFIVLLALGCQKSERPPLGESTRYFPSEVYDGPGVVWKYYVHSTPDGGERKTNIKYRKMVLENPKLFLTDYTADFLPSYNEVISIDNDQWKIDSTYSYNYRGSLDSLRTTTMYEIGTANAFVNWNGNAAILERRINNDNWKNETRSSQIEMKDTLVDGKKVKSFYGTLETNYRTEKDTILSLYNWRRDFTGGRGMTTQLFEGEGQTYEWQLDEIMSLKEFEKRAGHGMHRVGYIDPEKAIDNQKDFSTCYHISQINDYYNDDRAEHLGGKGGLWEMLENNLDASLLEGQEGYLTYRFVVNCEGKAGRFVTEEADLDYNRVEFSSDLRIHLLEMLLGVPLWKNLTVRGEPRDAYVYVTFKIRDDEIVEILP